MSTYNLITDKNTNVTININLEEEFIIFDAIFTSNFPKKCFFSKFNLQDIQKQRYFLMFENISEIFIEIKNFFEEKNIKIIEETNLLILYISINNTKIKDIVILINEKPIEIKEKIENLYYKINELENENKNLKEKILQLENKNQEYEKKFQIIEEKNNNKIDSLIGMEIDFEFIKKCISPNKKIDFELIFRMTRDGTTSNDFHKFCDGIGKTLFLIQTTKSFLFGGYTPFGWNKEQKDINDDDTFIFSLNLKLKLTRKKTNDKTQDYDEYYGPIIGGGKWDIFCRNSLLDGGSQNGNFQHNFELTFGENSFVTKELEVFKVIIK